MHIPTTATMDPTDRSMFRDTMMSTMPVAITATVEVWTDRFHRFRADRNSPLVATLNTSQSTINVMIMPSRRVSISSDRTDELTDRAGPEAVAGESAEKDGGPCGMASLIRRSSWGGATTSAPLRCGALGHDCG